MSTQSVTATTDLPVNVDASAAAVGGSVLAFVLAQATRPHGVDGAPLINYVESFVWDRDGGLSVVVVNAGVRQHLANALGFAKDVHDLILPRDYAQARRGFVLNVPVTIWNPRGA